MRELDFWLNVKKNIIGHKKLALAIVFDADHSTPGRKGFKMFVTESNSFRGSVGGGMVENMVINECKEMLHNNISKNYLKEYKLFGNSDESIGMICNGIQIIGYILLKEEHLGTIDEIINSINLNAAGCIRITEKDFVFIKDSSQDNKFNREEFIYQERIGSKNIVYIFGGGHVGLAVSRIMSHLDFRVIVIDSRKEVNTLIENTFADQILIKDFVEAANDIIENDLSYVVIVTPGHTHDKEVLRAVLHKKVKYIGMMGSESKVRTLYKELIAEGINTNDLSRVHSPIGLKIKSETPDEIAISIAAEIIGIKNTK